MNPLKNEILNAEETQTCFSVHAQHNIRCESNDCRNWIDSADHFNCAFVAAKGGNMTLQEIGDVFGITRMRICQIEKSILKKLNKEIRQRNLLHTPKE